MEEKPKKIIVEVYKEETTINVDIPVGYIYRFNELLTTFIPFKDEEHMLKVLDDIAKDQINDPFAYHVQTILAFLTLTEEAARKQNLLKKVEYDTETKTRKDIEE